MNDSRAQPLFQDPDPAAKPDRRVTALKATRRDPSRASIHVNGRVAGTLPRALAVELGAVAEAPWTPQLASRVEQAVAHDKAKRSALRTLERRAVSRGELIDRLVRKGHERIVAEDVAADLEGAGLINDEEYGRAALRQLVAAKPAGPRLMRSKLIKKRLDRGLIDRLVAEFSEADSDNPARDESITLMIERKLASMQRFDRPTQARRLYGLLARRGFDPGEARELVRRYAPLDQD